jgi:hypothetical protein
VISPGKQELSRGHQQPDQVVLAAAIHKAANSCMDLRDEEISPCALLGEARSGGRTISLSRAVCGFARSGRVDRVTFSSRYDAVRQRPMPIGTIDRALDTVRRRG